MTGLSGDGGWSNSFSARLAARPDGCRLAAGAPSPAAPGGPPREPARSEGPGAVSHGKSHELGFRLVASRG